MNPRDLPDEVRAAALALLDEAGALAAEADEPNRAEVRDVLRRETAAIQKIQAVLAQAIEAEYAAGVNVARGLFRAASAVLSEASAAIAEAYLTGARES